MRVWQLTTPVGEIAERLIEELPPGEQLRATRFHFPGDRACFVLARVALRRLLGRLIDCPPEAVQLGLGQLGKPFLVNQPSTGTRIEFNVAHSGETVVLALCRGTPVGIDVEVPRPVVDLGEIVGRYFQREEIRKWSSVPEEQQLEMFYRIWTRKEAFVKALGQGLNAPLDAFAIDINPAEKTFRLLSVPPGAPPVGEWSLFDLTELLAEQGESNPRLFAALAAPAFGLRVELQHDPLVEL